MRTQKGEEAHKSCASLLCECCQRLQLFSFLAPAHHWDPLTVWSLLSQHDSCGGLKTLKFTLVSNKSKTVQELQTVSIKSIATLVKLLHCWTWTREDRRAEYPVWGFQRWSICAKTNKEELRCSNWHVRQTRPPLRPQSCLSNQLHSIHIHYQHRSLKSLL